MSAYLLPLQIIAAPDKQFRVGLWAALSGSARKVWKRLGLRYNRHAVVKTSEIVVDGIRYEIEVVQSRLQYPRDRILIIQYNCCLYLGAVAEITRGPSSVLKYVICDSRARISDSHRLPQMFKRRQRKIHCPVRPFSENLFQCTRQWKRPVDSKLYCRIASIGNQSLIDVDPCAVWGALFDPIFFLVSYGNGRNLWTRREQRCRRDNREESRSLILVSNSD